MFRKLVMASLPVAACGVLVLMGQESSSPRVAIPVAQQNALVQKYCAVCHTDAKPGGRLSLEHFDGANPDPGVAAMLVSKLTSGLTPARIEASYKDPEAAAAIVRKMKTGAMGAAGLGVPDRATQDGLLSVLAAEGSGADQWFVSQAPGTVTASIVREVPSPLNKGDVDMYRLILTCSQDNHTGTMQVSWAPGGTAAGPSASISVDEEQGPTGVTLMSQPGAAMLSARLPLRTLTIRNMLPDETVAFPFGSLPEAARAAVARCFPAANSR